MSKGSHLAIEDSPPVEHIVKKIDFKDSILGCDGRRSSEGTGAVYCLLPKSSHKNLSKNNDVSSRGGTMVCNTNNQNCSFYLTPSSGH